MIVRQQYIVCGLFDSVDWSVHVTMAIVSRSRIGNFLSGCQNKY